MKISILGRRYEFRRCDLENRGECDSPDSKGKEIRVHKDLTGEELLEVTIHECLHAAGWHIDEQFVESFAEDLARVLWRLGFRRI